MENSFMSKFQYSFKNLKSYCEAKNFAGWDPYDGMNSKVFQALPLKYWDLARLAWIQGFKRSPINFRRLLLVPKQHNAKGIGLFLSGYCNLYQLAETGDTTYGSASEQLEKINELANLLLRMQTKGYSGACWGYNFDWQARRLFLFPKETPTVVATSFCVEALIKTYEITKKDTYLKTAVSAAEFVMNDLNRTPHPGGFLFSYSPFKGNNTVYNASLLGAKTLSLAYRYTKKDIYKTTAKQAVNAACNGQEEDGSWIYGLLPVQSWKDSFHTGYNLDALQAYQEHTGDESFQSYTDKGFDYYMKHFFESDGTPKYYHDRTYPIDIHCPAQLFVTLSKLDRFKVNKPLAEKVMDWSIVNMQDKKGYFYYQLKKGISSKISYMRWSNAFMFHAMSCYLKESYK